MGNIRGGMDLKEKVWVQYWKHLSNLKSGSKVYQSCPTLCDPMGCSLTGSSVHGIFQARILEWVAISFSRRSSQPRDWTWVSWVVGRRFTIWATREVFEGYLNGLGHWVSVALAKRTWPWIDIWVSSPCRLQLKLSWSHSGIRIQRKKSRGHQWRV